MMYLHCGWPRTSTTTIQSVLFANRELLASDGVVYPDRWTSEEKYCAHHGICEMIADSAEAQASLQGFKCFLADHSDRDVLLSAEGISDWLRWEDKGNRFLRLLSIIEETIAVECVWTLRRFDEVLESMYMAKLRHGTVHISPPEFFDSLQIHESLFRGLRRADEQPGSRATYVKYDVTGRHNAELLRAFNLSESTRRALLDELAKGPRRQARLGQKQVAALVDIESLSLRAGFELDPVALRRAFRRVGFRFEQDWRCELVDEGVKRAARERALAAAHRYGIDAYVDFFADVDVDGEEWPGLESDLITDEDLSRLVAYLREDGLQESKLGSLRGHR